MCTDVSVRPSVYRMVSAVTVTVRSGDVALWRVSAMVAVWWMVSAAMSLSRLHALLVLHAGQVMGTGGAGA